MTGCDGLVAVVDDDQSVRRALGRLLGAFGYDVELYESADAFLQNMKEVQPDCLLLDVRMPGAHGFTLQDALARQHRTAPIIFMTAHADIELAEHAMNLGAVGFLIKPIEADVLLDSVQAAIRQGSGGA